MTGWNTSDENTSGHPGRITTTMMSRPGKPVRRNEETVVKHPRLWHIAGRAPQCIQLARGDCLTCLQGLVWVTQASMDREEACSDIVLAPRERFCAAHAVTCLVSALHREPACVAIEAEAEWIADAWPAYIPYQEESHT
jgi:hypothetical protein